MIQLEDRNGIVVLRMAAGRGNALNVELASAIAETITDLERGPARAVVLTGQGNVFGAGVDLRSLIDGGADYVRRFLPVLVSAFERLAVFPKPLVAAVNGHAIAGGAILMLTADQRLLARGTARVGLTEVLVGVQFPPWAMEIARFATPREHFQTLILTGRTWLPDDALNRGLVDELVDADQLLDRACEVAEEMAAVPRCDLQRNQVGRSTPNDRDGPSPHGARGAKCHRTLVPARNAATDRRFRPTNSRPSIMR